MIILDCPGGHQRLADTLEGERQREVTHTHTHARMHARAHARAHKHTHTESDDLSVDPELPDL